MSEYLLLTRTIYYFLRSIKRARIIPTGNLLRFAWEQAFERGRKHVS